MKSSSRLYSDKCCSRKAYNLFDNCAVLEQDERWNAAHAKSRRRGWMMFNLDFRDLHALISLRKFFKNRGDLLAGPAPLRPEIQQTPLAGLEHITLRGGIADGFNRVVFTHSTPFFHP